MKNVNCPYCNKESEYVDSSIIYGKSYGMIYLCNGCRAYVGVHKGTDNPKGTLANAELRELRKECHALFDPIWQSGKQKRHNAYNWLSQKMGIPFKETHIGMFDENKCKKALAILNKHAHS